MHFIYIQGKKRAPPATSRAAPKRQAAAAPAGPRYSERVDDEDEVRDPMDGDINRDRDRDGDGNSDRYGDREIEI